jgi:hypothetical protein
MHSYIPPCPRPTKHRSTKHRSTKHPSIPHTSTQQQVTLCVYIRARIAAPQPTLLFVTTAPHHTPSTGIGRFYCFPGQYPAQAQKGKAALAVGGVASTRGRGAVSNTDSAAGPSAAASLHPVVAPLSVTLLGNGFEALSASGASTVSNASTASAESAAGGGSRGAVKLTPLCPSDQHCLCGTFELCNSQQ